VLNSIRQTVFGVAELLFYDASTLSIKKKPQMIDIFYSLEAISAWQSALLTWFKNHGKSYPWRKTADPYAILVSEMMLQQTQIKTVLERRYFEDWMIKFPDLKTLAEAREEEVLKAWEGLGYYNRGRNLQKAAIYIMRELGGVFPESPSGVASLPGVGPYTVGAVCSFAFNLPTPVVDGNVIRVLARAFKITEPVDTAPVKKQLWKYAEALTSPSHPRIYNSAMMELGQTICTKGRPACGKCPVSQWCRSKDDAAAHQLPIKKTKVTITRKKEWVLLLKKGEKVFLTQETGSRRKGLWKLPETEPETVADLEEIGSITYPITRYLVEMRVFTSLESKEILKLSKKYLGEWFDLGSPLPPMGAPYLRALQECGTIKKAEF
jgi:A/G-specific adenine glycosylase